MRGIADEAYATGIQDCLKEICARAYIARALRLGRRGNYRIPAMPFGIPAPVDSTLFINGKHDSVIDSIAAGAAQEYLDLMITDEDAVVARFDALPTRHPARRNQAKDMMRRMSAATA